MNAIIEEQRNSVVSEYNISTPVGNFHGRKKLFSLLGRLILESESGDPLVEIDGEFSPVRSRHEFRFADGRAYRFECQKLWKRVFTCAGNGQTYLFYEHRGLRFSIFQDEQQIAAIVKNRVVWGNGNRYDIRLDSDADLLVVLCMVLT
ncbi:MAG: hypothetical protein ACREIC_25055, partial [Limisphaerales bacterium]